jgi:hypothetical protein
MVKKCKCQYFSTNAEGVRVCSVCGKPAGEGHKCLYFRPGPGGVRVCTECGKPAPMKPADLTEGHKCRYFRMGEDGIRRCAECGKSAIEDKLVEAHEDKGA